MIDYIARDMSFLTGQKTMEPLYTLKNFPVFIGCTDKVQKDDLYADMEFSICRETGIIQLSKLLPPDLVYSDYHSEAVGGFWKQHFEKFSQFILDQNPRSILEICGGNGELVTLLIQQNPHIKFTVVEPTPGPNLLALRDEYGEDRLKVVAAFFDKNFKLDEAVDTVVHSHVLEHAYDPLGFLQNVHDTLEIGGKHIFVVPNLYLYLQNHQPNALNYEHTYLITEEITDYWMSKFGFDIVKKYHFGDHGVFYACEKVRTGTEPHLIRKYDLYKKVYLDFIDYNQRLVQSLNKKMVDFQGDVYLFGAHIFSQFLLHFGLDRSKIVSVLDNSAAKQGQRLYGSDLYVQNPETIKDKERVAIILRVGAYREEVFKQLREINKNVVLFEE